MAKDLLSDFARTDQIITYATDRTKPTVVKDVRAFGPNIFGDKKLWEVWYYKTKDGEYDTCYITELKRLDGKVKLEFYQNFSDFAFFLNNQIDEKSNEFQLRKYAIAVAILIIGTIVLYSIFMQVISGSGLSVKELAVFVGSALAASIGYAFFRKSQSMRQPID